MQGLSDIDYERSAKRGEKFFLKKTDKSQYEWPAGDTFEKLISPVLSIRASHSFHFWVDPFYKKMTATRLIWGSAWRVARAA